MRLSTCFGILLLLAACVVAQKDRNATYADALNGERSHPGMVLGAGVPVIISDPKPVQRRISGKVFCGNGIAETLVRHGDVELRSGGKVIATASWREEGTFVLFAVFNRNTFYTVNVKVDCGQAAKAVPVNLLSDLSDFDFHMQDLVR